MPICRVKRGERPSESRERNTAIHHWIFLDICGVIKSDELMPDYLRINPKRHYRETEQDDEIGSFQSCGVAKRDDTLSLRRSKSSFSLSRCSFGHLFTRLPEDGQPKYLRCRKHSNFFRAATGLDFSQEMIVIAQKMFPQIEFREGDAQNLPFAESSFDRVLGQLRPNVVSTRKLSMPPRPRAAHS